MKTRANSSILAKALKPKKSAIIIENEENQELAIEISSDNAENDVLQASHFENFFITNFGN